MISPQSLPWIEPLDLAASIDEPYWVLLYSGVKTNYSGRYSYLAHSLAERIEGADFSALENKLNSDKATFDNAWFGYLGYGLKNRLEKLTLDKPNWLSLPDLCMMRFHAIYQFDHSECRVTRWSQVPPPAGEGLGEESSVTPQQAHPLSSLPPQSVFAKASPDMAGERTAHVTSLRSNMTDENYLEKAAHIIECIHRGDLYQANLTRKFVGSFSDDPNYFTLFRKLCAVSPAPYSAFMRFGDVNILSSSPELFLHIDGTDTIRTRPIKGTSPRFRNAEQNRKSLEALATSEKDKTENLMIADLMRNDLSRTCLPGSVRAKNLFEVTSHATIHHMSSTVTGTKRPEYSTLDTIKACFPPGSMTGAPKIAAMNLCSRMEEVERGVYSGAIGWFGGDGSCELSVIIRTLIMKGKDFEFQVGGGIVADSTPEGELQETREKSKGIVMALGIIPQS